MGIRIFNLKELIESLADKQMKLIIGLSSFTESKRAESYVDQYRSSFKLADSEFLFLPVKNSGFLGLQENDAIFPNNILWCIMKICKGLKICLNKVSVNSSLNYSTHSPRILKGVISMFQGSSLFQSSAV